MGCAASSSASLKECCDEYIAWPLTTSKCITVASAIHSIFERCGCESMNCSQLKSKLLELDATFTERNYGQSSFHNFLKSLGFNLVKVKGGWHACA
jgi:hypothetical protein